MDHKVIIERLENVPAYERVVDTRIPVTLQIRQLMLANIHHLNGLLFSPVGIPQLGVFAVPCQSVISEWEGEREVRDGLGRTMQSGEVRKQMSSKI